MSLIVNYYLRHQIPKHGVVASIAIVKDDDGVWSRGVSIKSIKDRHIKKIGYELSTERAYTAKEFENRETNIFPLRVIPSLSSVHLDDYSKVLSMPLKGKTTPTFEQKLAKLLYAKRQYNIKLTDFEKYIVDRYHKNELN